MRIQLIDRNVELINAWRRLFGNIPDVEIYLGSAFDRPTECIVSPANGFGFMDGGFDAVITRVLGAGVQANVQEKIQKEYNGELLVGQAFYVETGSVLVPYCICAPTMRVPMYLGPESTIVYQVARAIFLILRQPNLPFESVTFTGLGTGVGKVPYDLCAYQMHRAYVDFYLGQYQFPASWRLAQLNHMGLYTDSIRDIQFEA